MFKSNRSSNMLRRPVTSGDMLALAVVQVICTAAIAYPIFEIFGLMLVSADKDYSLHKDLFNKPNE